MSLTRFTYCVIRYVHDPLSGEALNVGVVIFSPAAGVLKAKLLTKRTRRLAEAFRDFDIRAHSYVMHELEKGLAFLYPEGYGSNGTLFSTATGDVEAVLRSLWPDRGTRYSFSQSSGGASGDVKATLDLLYDRFVTSQMPPSEEDESRKDELLWSRAELRLRQKVDLHKLHQRTVPTDIGPVAVTRVHENGKLDLVQPLSFDLATSVSIARKAALWYGRAASFERTPQIGRVLYLIGAPKAASKEGDFIRARDFLLRAEKVTFFSFDNLDPFVNAVEEIVGSRG